MSRLIKIEVQDQGSFAAKQGDGLLEAALRNGIDLPHDCRAGICGTCRVRIVAGAAQGGTTGEPDAVLACQAKVSGPLTLAIDDVPAAETLSTRVSAIVDLAPDVCEVVLAAARPLPVLPGQYCRFRFQGFAPRCYSPTVRLAGAHEPHVMRLHVRRIRGGQVSSALGHAIRPGHRVKLTGPFGSAYLRPASSGRLVLVASGTGFAPIWSIAFAALCEMPDRPMVVVVAARSRHSLYMAPALLRLATFPKVRVIPVLSRNQGSDSVFPVGNAVDFLPPLQPTDSVYVAGNPAMVNVVEALARQASARCYADPFVAQTDEAAGLLTRARQWLTPPPRRPAVSVARAKPLTPRPLRQAHV
jgi:NAD(P)H-flavin reductase/ferredoxin